MIQIADPGLFAIVASDQPRRFYRLLECGPFLLTGSVFRLTCLQTSLVCIRSRISDILLSVSLSKEQTQADATCHPGVCAVESLGSRNGGSQVHNVLEWSSRILRVGWRRLHDLEELAILVDQRLNVGIEVRRGNSKFIGS